MSPKYSIEIDCNGVESDFGYRGDYGFYSNYGTIVAQGNTLEELLDDATVDIQDQDGGELCVREADEQWMQDLIVQKLNALVGKKTKAD